MMRKSNLLFLISLLFTGACDLSNPSDGIPIDQIVTLTSDKASVLANGVDKVVLTAELGPLSDAEQTVLFSTEDGELEGSDPENRRIFEKKTNERRAQAVLVSSVNAAEDVAVFAEVGDFKTQLDIVFRRAYPEAMKLTADKNVVDANRIDFATLEVELFRNEGKPSTNQLVDFQAVTLDSATAEIEPFAFTEGSMAMIEIKSGNGQPGSVQVTATTQGEDGGELSQSLVITFE